MENCGRQTHTHTRSFLSFLVSELTSGNSARTGRGCRAPGRGLCSEDSAEPMSQRWGPPATWLPHTEGTAV